MKLASEYRDRVDFLVVYLEEAHPTDGWMFGMVTHFIPQHTSMHARLTASDALRQEIASLTSEPLLPVAVDLMDNTASRAYGALPERLAIIHDSRLHWLGGRGPEDFSTNALQAELELLLREMV